MSDTSDRLEVTIDQAECVSAGRCVSSAPTYFEFDSDELASVRPDAIPMDDDALIRVARQCPNGAIRLSRNGVEIEL